MDTVMELEIGPGPEPGSYVVRVLRSVGGGHGQRLAPSRRESTPRAELAQHPPAFLDSPRAQGYNLPPHAPIAQLDRASDYGSEG